MIRSSALCYIGDTPPGCVRFSADTNARLQIAGLCLFPGCHWSIEKVMSNFKLSLFKTKAKSPRMNGLRFTDKVQILWKKLEFQLNLFVSRCNGKGIVQRQVRSEEEVS